MGIKSGIELSSRDIYMDYPFEGIMIRWEYRLRKMYRKFYGSTFEVETSLNYRLITDALLYGDEISKEVYLIGKPDQPELHSNI